MTFINILEHFDGFLSLAFSAICKLNKVIYEQLIKLD